MVFPLGERITASRKKKGITQDDLAKAIGAHAPVIGRYERGEVKPSFDVAAKIAQALGTSLDYLAGFTDKELDVNLIEKVTTIQMLPAEDKEHILKTLNALIRDAKVRNAHK